MLVGGKWPFSLAVAIGRAAPALLGGKWSISLAVAIGWAAPVLVGGKWSFSLVVSSGAGRGGASPLLDSCWR